MKSALISVLIVFCFLLLAIKDTEAQPSAVTGRLTDPAGTPVSDVRVRLTGDKGAPQETVSSADGRFSFGTVQAGEYQLAAEHAGFRKLQKSILVSDGKALDELTIQLQILDVFASVTTISDSAEALTSRQGSSINTLGRSQIDAAGASALDDLLRQVPGFSNFRRSSSVVANPTTQGVSLRGAGASGASRTLVNIDSIPLNDAFGGWVYWDRVPRESIDTIDVERGGASHLYGSDALSGAINISTRRVKGPVISASTSYGNLSTGDVSFFAGDKWGRTDVAVSGEGYRTDGYFIIPSNLQGAADAKARSSHRTIGVRIGSQITGQLSFFIKGYLYDQNRNNGTQLQTNDTGNQGLSAGMTYSSGSVGTLVFNVFGSKELYHQIFTSVAANRATETLSRQQGAPSRDAGFRLNWTKSAGTIQTLFAGVELRGVRGTSDETVWAAGKASSQVSAGGRQKRFGISGQDYLNFNRFLALAISLRYDEWRDSSGGSVTRNLTTGAVTPTFFAPRTDNNLSPRIALIIRPVARLDLHVAAYRAFRAPTLNELYRSFRVGDTLTTANENLVAERLNGGEAGLNWNPASKLTFRLTGYYTQIVNPITNYTISVTSTLTTRQRRNLGRNQSQGIEAEFEYELSRNFRINAGYYLADATVLRAPQDVRLEGLQVPQVPRHQFTAQISYSNPSLFFAGVQFRTASQQFDDDQNLLPLKRYALTDASISRRLVRYLDAFFSVQNLFNSQYSVARTPIESLGMPRMFRGGLRIRLEP